MKERQRRPAERDVTFNNNIYVEFCKNIFHDESKLSLFWKKKLTAHC